MEVKIKDVSEDSIKTGLLVLPFFEDKKTDLYDNLDVRVGGLIKKVVSSREFTGKEKQTCLLHVEGIGAGRLLLAGLGKVADVKQERLRRVGGKVFSTILPTGVDEFAVSTSAFSDHKINSDFSPIYYFMEGLLLKSYIFDKYKSKSTKDSDENKKEIAGCTIISSRDGDGTALAWLETVIGATRFARDLANTPANELTPTAMANAAKNLAGKLVKVKVLDLKDIEKEGMGSYLAVARGSAQPPKFIVIEYNGGKGVPMAIIGKSITFDSGGISLKPSEKMEEMKYDMAGGAATLGIMKAVSEAQLPLNIVAILPATENMPGGNATRPGDVVTAINGKTIEIINTDAEGRLALVDALGYAIKHYKPAFAIDMATLTGACSVAFGDEAIAMMGNDEGTMEKLKAASEETYERVWQMPLYEELKEYLKSDVADIKNVGTRKGGLITSGYFLKEFVGDQPWVHLDIAATAWYTEGRDYIDKGATSVGVRLILSLLKRLAGEKR
ncbi:MAG: leucyl aminopeptidase [Nitrospirae bacterium]|nr:leucyl aminopeptidase [Nitrospirota bacterium]